MKRIKYIIASAALAAVASASAQVNYSGYFLESNLFGHTLNPAFGNSDNYISMPVIGNTGFELYGNLNLRDVLFVRDGRTVLFTNPKVSAEDFMKNISCHDKINSDVDLNILSAGFKAWGGYNTIEIGAHGDVHTRMPRAIFSFLKEGATNATYDISNINARAQGYVSAAFGHSRALGDKWRIGAKVKFLVGAGNFDANLDKAILTLDRNVWHITTNATVHTSVKGAYYKTSVNKYTGNEYVDNIDIEDGGIDGFGAAIDLGALFKPSADWTLSFSVLDLGFISWNNDVVASTNGDHNFNTSVYSFNANTHAANSFSDEWKNVRRDLTSLYELADNGDMGRRTTLLNATVNIGVSYTLPAYRALTFGLLNTTRVAGVYSTTDFRLSANITPLKWLSAGINGVAGTYGLGYGWILQFHPKVFDLYLSMDNTLGRLAKQGAPLNTNASFALGMNFKF